MIQFVVLMEITIKTNVYVDAKETVRNIHLVDVLLRNLVQDVLVFQNQFVPKVELLMIILVIYNVLEINLVIKDTVMLQKEMTILQNMMEIVLTSVNLQITSNKKTETDLIKEVFILTIFIFKFFVNELIYCKSF